MENYARAARLVNLGHVANNIRAIRKLISPNAMIMAVVKADAYGHGLCEVSKAAIGAGADWLGCATVKEALTVRGLGIQAPILVLSPVFEEEYESLVAHDLVATVFALESCERLSALAVKLGKTASVHIKIDTGMRRVGYNALEPETALREIAAMSRLPGIAIGGMYSHLAASDSNPGFTSEQFARFQNIARILDNNGLRVPVKHISNSGGVLNHPECNLDMVRCGVLVYGLAPDSTPEGAARLSSLGFKPPLEFKSRVSQVKTVRKGESVGYSRNYFAATDIEVASVPIGYADGVSRSLSNKGKVLINGRACDIIGNVCMDQFMVDVTGVPAKVRDEVVVIGESGGRRISAEDVAALQGTINYEVATSLSLRVPAHYV